MRSGALFLVGAIATSLLGASCAIVGYDLGGYGPAVGGASSSGGHGGSGGAGGGTSSTGAGAGCGAGRTCSEAPPKGWLGPVALAENQKGATCPDDFPNLLFLGGASPQGTPATCSGCTCDTKPCNANTIVRTYTDAACTTSPLAYALSTTCGNVAPVGAPHVVVAAPTATGTCLPSSITVNTAPPSFGTTVVACGGAKLGGGCDASGVCAPTPKAPFEAGLCIFRSGNVACPAGLTKRVFFDGIDDTRGCTPCTCGPAAATCQASVTLASDTACTQNVGTAVSGGGCATLAASWNSGITKLTSPCTPVDGQPTGDVAGLGPTTFCCE